VVVVVTGCRFFGSNNKKRNFPLQKEGRNDYTRFESYYDL